tara:strand:+ start:2311 stop:4365 length:2055 start_codon:yes stop_codon:yes gene_type:complete
MGIPPLEYSPFLMSDKPKQVKKPSIDSLSSTAQAKQAAIDNVPPELRKRMKMIILFFIGMPYVAYVIWCLFLISIFPNRTGAFQTLLMPAVMSCGIAALVLVIVGLLFLKRIMRKGVPNAGKVMGVIRLLLFLIPGLALSGIVPTMIMREPSLILEITSPGPGVKLIAPLAITYNLESSVSVLERRGLSVLEYSWDFDGDGEENDKTVLPEATGLYERQGAYVVSVVMTLNNNTKRKISKRIAIPEEVFSFSPIRPGVDEPIRFSVERLVDDIEMITEVQWDFDADDIVDTVSDLPDAVHTYLRTGTVGVIATVKLNNQTQKTYEREIEIFEPQPPPFPVKIISEPSILIGPAPFGTIFRVESEVDLGDVIWEFGDGEKKRGDRVGHTFQQRGVYQVSARVHATSGEVAQLSNVVRVVDNLKLPDLAFDGSHTVDDKNGIVAEVPVTINLKPRSTMPLIDFKWEAPGATSVGSTDHELQAIYRRPGHYDITLIAQDPEGKVLRHIIPLTVEPPSTQVKIHMNPEGGIAPLEVRFDASETVIPNEEISGFEWKFGDTKSDAPQQRGALVEHMFEVPGTFTVVLTAFTTSGKSFSSDKTIVIRAPVLDACAVPSRSSGKAPLGVSFDTSCTTGNAVEINWNFGDKSESDELNPIHVFEESGTYRVELTLKDAVGSTSSTTIKITVE